MAPKGTDSDSLGSTVLEKVRKVEPAKADCRVGFCERRSQPAWHSDDESDWARTTTSQLPKPSVQVHAPREHTGVPSPFVKDMPDDDDDEAPLTALSALAHEASVVQTPQVGPEKPSEHCCAQPALALPDRTAEKTCLLAAGTSGFSHVGAVHPLAGEKPGGHWQVPLASEVP